MTTEPQGVQFPADDAGQRSTTATNKAIYSAALRGIDEQAARAIRDEPDWRRRYPAHLRALTAAGLARPEHALAIAAAALDESWRQFTFVREGRALPFAEALDCPAPRPFGTLELRGHGPQTIEPWSLPYRGRRLQGAELRAQIDRWERRGIVEPSHAGALRRVLEHPEWFDLSDRTLVLLGAGAEAGPLAALARWRANIVAVDVPRPEIWRAIARTVEAGNGRLLAPAAPGAEPAIERAGADLLTQTPEIAAWLLSLGRPLDIAAIAYLDGERHVRVSLAMDGIMARVSAAAPGTTLMYMATPTDVFAVPEETARAAMRNYAERGASGRLVSAPVRALSGGRLLRPHVAGLVDGGNGRRYGIVDGLVVEQGPNYALAKRLQQWRAVTARAAGQRVSLNVAPSTLTRSVTKNPALKAGYAGADIFGIEVFEPETTNAIMAALWVHDLRCTGCAADPAAPLAHPLDLLSEGANHGGLWRVGYLPRSALPIAAALGYARGIIRRA